MPRNNGNSVNAVALLKSNHAPGGKGADWYAAVEEVSGFEVRTPPVHPPRVAEACVADDGAAEISARGTQ